MPTLLLVRGTPNASLKLHATSQSVLHNHQNTNSGSQQQCRQAHRTENVASSASMVGKISMLKGKAITECANLECNHVYLSVQPILRVMHENIVDLTNPKRWVLLSSTYCCSLINRLLSSQEFTVIRNHAFGEDQARQDLNCYLLVCDWQLLRFCSQAEYKTWHLNDRKYQEQTNAYLS